MEGKQRPQTADYTWCTSGREDLANLTCVRFHSASFWWLSPRVILEGSRIFEEFKGALTEQFVCQELQTLRSLQTNYYWTSSSVAEVDFLLSDGSEVWPLECKAGFTMNAKSLKSYCGKYLPRLALRASLMAYDRRESPTVVNIPLYMLFVLPDEVKE